MVEARKVVDKFIKDKLYPPSYREVAEILGVSSPNTAYQRLRGYRKNMVQSNKLLKK